MKSVNFENFLKSIYKIYEDNGFKPSNIYFHHNKKWGMVEEDGFDYVLIEDDDYKYIGYVINGKVLKGSEGANLFSFLSDSSNINLLNLDLFVELDYPTVEPYLP